MTARNAFRRIATQGLMWIGVWLGGCSAFQSPAHLQESFSEPPPSARPWVYWFWNNSNITKEGITADLEAMKRVGIGGVLIMEVDQGAPVGPVAFMSDSWRALFKHVVVEAQRLGIEVNMNDDAGWNGSGGPWIKPEQAMQRVVFSELDVEGPRHMEATLAQPKAVANYYQDISVLAFPAAGSYRIEKINEKAFYDFGGPIAPFTGTEPAAEMIVARDKVLDLSPKMNKDGRLTWDVPAGKWTILRMGHTCTGAENAPAPLSGRGLECDKLSKAGIEANFNGMMAKLIEDNNSGVGAGKTLVHTHIDSWENGAQNWSSELRAEFQKRRGYDLQPFLPTMTGRVVGSLELSERFLWDLRQTISELIVENYAGHMHTLAARHGMKLTIEGYFAPCNELTYVGRADEPMGEFWIGGGAMETLKEMSSAAHIYGKTIVGAESFTANDSEKWLKHPGIIKSLGDQAFCSGINRFVFHRYAMQPWLEVKPGMTMGPWGLHYERTNTWWDWSLPWHEYLARCQFMLRQGRFVADVCYLMPEASPQNASGRAKGLYDYDDCNAEVVMTRMSVQNGRLVLPDGVSYRIMVLPNVPTMTPALLKKIQELVEAGATVVGARPVKSPSLSNYPACDAQVKQLADELWGDCDGKTITERKVGKGRVVCGLAPEKVLASAGVEPDFRGAPGLRYIHRAAGDVDAYFVANSLSAPVQAICAFRVTGKAPELWWPETGRCEPAAAFAEKNGTTSVSVPLGPSESVFVVFRSGGTKQDSVVALARDGKALWSLSDKAPQVVVKSARYGVIGDPQRTRDVREKAQQLVNGGELSFQVARMAEGDDPAFGTVKTLILEYMVGDKKFAVTGRDPETVQLTGDPARVVIEKATYGVPGDAQRTRDVKAKIQHLINLGTARFEVRRLAEGDDPANLVVKTVVIEYTLNGKQLTLSATDAETIDLTQGGSAESVADVRMDAQGISLQAWQPGSYELKTASGRVRRVEVSDVAAAREVTGSWEVSFPAKTGAPPHVTLDPLASLSQNSEAGVKYFSGVATYTKKIDIAEALLAQGHRLFLDLGNVQVMAAVRLNGKPLGIQWKAPYRVDITDAARPGENDLEIQVVNLWINRMIGDEQLPEDSPRNPNGTLKSMPKWVGEGKPSPTGRFTFTIWRLWGKDAPLQDSGLIGPVTLRPAAVIMADK